MPKDAKKPYFKAQSARTLYTYFDTKTSHFSMKILGELEKSCSFTVKMTVFEKLVYRVRALWVLKLGFLASLGITRQGKIFKNHLQVLPLSFHLSWPGGRGLSSPARPRLQSPLTRFAPSADFYASHLRKLLQQNVASCARPPCEWATNKWYLHWMRFARYSCRNSRV